MRIVAREISSDARQLQFAFTLQSFKAGAALRGGARVRPRPTAEPTSARTPPCGCASLRSVARSARLSPVPQLRSPAQPVASSPPGDRRTVPCPAPGRSRSNWLSSLDPERSLVIEASCAAPRAVLVSCRLRDALPLISIADGEIETTCRARLSPVRALSRSKPRSMRSWTFAVRWASRRSRAVRATIDGVGPAPFLRRSPSRRGVGEVARSTAGSRWSTPSLQPHRRSR